MSVTQEALSNSDRHKSLFPSDCIARNYWISPRGHLYLFPGGSKDDSQSLKPFHVMKIQIYYYWIDYIFDSKFKLTGKIRLLLSSCTGFIINLFIWNLIILGRSNKLFKAVFCPQTQIQQISRHSITHHTQLLQKSRWCLENNYGGSRVTDQLLGTNHWLF